MILPLIQVLLLILWHFIPTIPWWLIWLPGIWWGFWTFFAIFLYAVAGWGITRTLKTSSAHSSW